MRTLISNKIFVYGASKELTEWCEKHLVIVNPTYATLKRLGKDDTIIRKHIPESMYLYVEKNHNDLIIPFGVLRAIWSYIKDSPVELKFNENKTVINQHQEISMPLFDYQERAVQKMLQAKGGIIEASCGAGKTTLGIELAKRLGQNTLWLCHTSDLLNQTVNRIKKLYPLLPVGTITEGKVSMVKNGITVSTIQTISNLDPDIYREHFNTIITDECHRVSSSPTLQKMFGRVLDTIPARYKFGLTATPKRSDTLIKSMYCSLGVNEDGKFAPTHIIPKSETNTLTAKHIRIDLNTPFSFETVQTDGMIDYNALIDFLSENKERNERIIEDSINALKTHKKEVILCQRVAHAKLLYEMLLAKGIKAVLLVGDVSKKERKQILEGHKEYSIIVATYALCAEGLDIPDLSLLVYAMFTGNEKDTTQSAGRIERVCEGKAEPEIYDYVDINYPYCVKKFEKRRKCLAKRK